MYQAGTNGTSECKSHLVVVMLLSLVFGRLMLMVPRLCCNVDFGQVVAFSVTSLLHLPHEMVPRGFVHLFRFFVDNL
jgi:hypothetical protein